MNGKLWAEIFFSTQLPTGKLYTETLVNYALK